MFSYLLTYSRTYRYPPPATRYPPCRHTDIRGAQGRLHGEEVARRQGEAGNQGGERVKDRSAAAGVHV